MGEVVPARTSPTLHIWSYVNPDAFLFWIISVLFYDACSNVLPMKYYYNLRVNVCALSACKPTGLCQIALQMQLS